MLLTRYEKHLVCRHFKSCKSHAAGLPGPINGANMLALSAAVSLYSQNRCLATDKDLQLKQQAWDDFLLTTHWPSHNVRAFPGLGKSATYYASAGADEQQGSAEPLEPVAAAATAAGSASSAAAGTAASEEAGAAAEQQQQSYWKARAADGSAQALLASIRTRHLVEDAALRKLAGVQLYEAAEVRSKQPLLEWCDHNPGHSCTQPQAAR